MNSVIEAGAALPLTEDKLITLMEASQVISLLPPILVAELSQCGVLVGLIPFFGDAGYGPCGLCKETCALALAGY